MPRPVLEAADIFRDHGAAWRDANRGHVSLGQLKVMSAIERCRTAALGGHVARLARTRPARARSSPSTAAVTGIARNVRGARRGSGSPNARPGFCPCPTSTWCSRCPRPSPASPIGTKPRSTASCSRLRRRPCSGSPPVPSIWARASASPRCSTRAHSGEVPRDSPPGVRAY